MDPVISSSNSTSGLFWEESNGLLASLIPQAPGSALVADPQTFNSLRGDLKLGPMPVSDELRMEAEKASREQALTDRDPAAQMDTHHAQRSLPPGVVAPDMTDLLPHPPTFKTMDIHREVEKVRDARKRIKLEPSALSSIDPNSPQGMVMRSKALPSICAYTLHDIPEGYGTCLFALNASLMNLKLSMLLFFARYITFSCRFRRELYPPLEFKR